MTEKMFSEMTLRQAYAAQALAGLLANSDNNQTPRTELAKDAFMYADAMIAAGEKK